MIAFNRIGKQYGRQVLFVDASFQLNPGEKVGLVGPNGSGKSTMLKLIAGITKPTTGTVTVQGRISALIELGAGFHPEISGRENVFINGVMLGLSTREIASRFDEIVAFAELEQFIDAPVKTYSSGMYMRLGFAVAVHVDPDLVAAAVDTAAEFGIPVRAALAVEAAVTAGCDRLLTEALPHGTVVRNLVIEDPGDRGEEIRT